MNIKLTPHLYHIGRSPYVNDASDHLPAYVTIGYEKGNDFILPDDFYIFCTDLGMHLTYKTPIDEERPQDGDIEHSVFVNFACANPTGPCDEFEDAKNRLLNLLSMKKQQLLDYQEVTSL